MFCKIIVAAVVGRNGHDGACTISGQHIIGHPDGNGLTVERVEAISAGKFAGHLFYLCHPFPFRTVHGSVNILINSLFSVGSCDLRDQFMFRGQHHEGGSENSIGAGGKNAEAKV